MSMNSPTLELGQVIGDTYRITAQLGAGGMGAVFAAEHLRLPGKQVAIKVLHATVSSSELLLRFRREAEIASRIGHPNIVEVLDFNTLPDGSPYLVMELLAGESLSARLRRGPLPEAAALSIARQIGSALAAAHRMGVVHRDLKPDNIFLCPSEVDGELRDQVKVLDFGISKIRGSQTVVTQDAAVMGTPHYMSPEQASGKNQDIDARTDIFALGAIVYEMLSGHLAFPVDSFPQVIYRVVFEPHPSLAPLVSQGSPRVIAAIDRALAKRAADRFADMAEFILALTGRHLGITVSSKEGALPAPAGLGTSDTALAATASVPAPGVASLPTLPAGIEVLPTAVAGATLPTRGRKQLVWLAAGFLACALGVGLFLLRGKAENPPSDQGASSRPVVAAVLPASPDAGAAVHPLVFDAAAVAQDARSEPIPVLIAPRGKHVAREESLAPAVAAELDAALAALNQGNAAEAIRKARHSLFEQKTSRAFVILTRAYCKTGDLGAAQASLRNVAASERTQVVRACKAAGMDL